MIACTAVCVLVARPAYAAPIDPNTTPTMSARAATDPTPTPTPTPPTTGTLPSATDPVNAFPAVTGPLASKIMKEEALVEALGQQVQALQQSVATDNVWTSQAFAKWQSAVSTLGTAEDATTRAATNAYENYDRLGPLQQYGSDIQQLNLLAPGLLGPPTAGAGTSTATDLTQAKADEAAAYQAYLQTLSAQQTLQDQLDQQQADYATRHDAVMKLIKDNQAALKLADQASRNTTRPTARTCRCPPTSTARSPTRRRSRRSTSPWLSSATPTSSEMRARTPTTVPA
jgi:hypothetical protein